MTSNISSEDLKNAILSGKIKLEDLSKDNELLDNKEFLLEYLRADEWSDIDHTKSIENISDRLKADKDVAFLAVKNCSVNLRYVSDSLKKDDKDFFDIIIQGVKSDIAHGFTDVFEYAPEAILNDKALMIAAIKINPEAYHSLGYFIKDDEEIALIALKESPLSMRSAPESIRDNKEVVMEVLKRSGTAYYDISTRLKDDPEVLLTALTTLKSNPEQMEYHNGFKNSILDRASQRLQILINDRDPIPILEVLTSAKKVDESMRKSEDSKSQDLKQSI